MQSLLWINWSGPLLIRWLYLGICWPSVLSIQYLNPYLLFDDCVLGIHWSSVLTQYSVFKSKLTFNDCVLGIHWSSVGQLQWRQQEKVECGHVIGEQNHQSTILTWSLIIWWAQVGEPPLVFLDEPSTGVDPVARRNLWSIIGWIMMIMTQYSMMTMTMFWHWNDDNDDKVESSETANQWCWPATAWRSARRCVTGLPSWSTGSSRCCRSTA